MKEFKTELEHYFIDDKGRWHGERKVFYSGAPGRLFFRGFYQHDLLHGENRTYSRKGKIYDLSMFNRGEEIPLSENDKKELISAKSKEEYLFLKIKYGLPLICGSKYDLNQV